MRIPAKRLARLEIISSKNTIAETSITFGPMPHMKPTIPTPMPNMIRVGMSGAFTALTRSPRMPTIAGRSVRLASTATNTTRMDPTLKAWNTRSGMRSMPSSAKTTVIPLNTTARPAVAHAFSTASASDSPFPRSSR